MQTVDRVEDGYLDPRRRALAAIRKAELAASCGDVELSRTVLGGLVGEVDQRRPVLSQLCARLATQLEAWDLALHFALCHFVATKGRWRDAATAVGRAAGRFPGLREAAERVVRETGSIDDWCLIAEADSLAAWPELAALGRGGVHSARSLEDLRRGGHVDSIGLDKPVAWRVRSARVTWNGHGCAVGCLDSQSHGRHHYVPELSDDNCGAALDWLGSQPTEQEGSAVGVIVRRFPLTNYYHWLVDGARDLLLLRDTGLLEQLDWVIVCMSAPPARFFAESLRALRFDPAKIEVRFEPFDIAGQTVTMVPADAVPVARHVARLRERILPDDDRAERAVRRLYISRRDAARRRVAAEDELEAALIPFGFATIVPGGLSFGEQVDAFSEAELIVAPHGAALASLVFAPSSATLIELAPEQQVPTCYRAIAEVVGMRYAAVACPYVPGTAGPLDLHVDIEAVVRLVRTMLPT